MKENKPKLHDKVSCSIISSRLAGLQIHTSPLVQLKSDKPFTKLTHVGFHLLLLLTCCYAIRSLLKKKHYTRERQRRNFTQESAKTSEGRPHGALIDRRWATTLHSRTMNTVTVELWEIKLLMSYQIGAIEPEKQTELRSFITFLTSHSDKSEKSTAVLNSTALFFSFFPFLEADYQI